MKSNIDKILATLAFVFVLLISIVVLRTPAVTGYELTIYDAYPIYFWYLFILVMACGIGILIHQSFSKTSTKWGITGLLIVIFSTTTFLALPLFRGYSFFPAGDAMTHAGYIKDIIANGTISKDNYYPVEHLLAANLVYVTELSLNVIINLLVILFNILFLLGIYCLSSVITNNGGKILFVTAFACPLIFSGLHILFHPSMFALYLLPLLLYLTFKIGKHNTSLWGYNLALVLLAIVITFTHPVTCLYAIILLVTLNWSISLYRRIKRVKNSVLGEVFVVKTYIPVIMSVIFVSWYLTFNSIQTSIKQVYDYLVIGSSASLFTQQSSQLSSSGITWFQTFQIFIYSYGTVLIYGIMSAAALLIIVKRVIIKNSQLDYIGFIISMLFIASIAVSAFSLFGFTGEYSPLRVARFVMFTAPLVIGLVFYEGATKGFEKLKSGRLHTRSMLSLGGICILVLLTVIISTFNVYNSPRIVELNPQVSNMDIQGTRWFSVYQDKTIIVAEVNLALYRYDALNFGIDSNPLTRAVEDQEIIPSDFGYGTNDSIGDTYNSESRYFILSQMDKISYLVVPENVREKAHRYTGHGYSKLMLDPLATKIYTNREFEAWLINQYNQ